MLSLRATLRVFTFPGGVTVGALAGLLPPVDELPTAPLCVAVLCCGFAAFFAVGAENMGKSMVDATRSSALFFLMPLPVARYG